MTKTAQFDLIKGIFDAEEAKEVLLYLIDGKIQFHNRRIFSDKIRYGTENSDSINRIKELEEMRKNILEAIGTDKLLIHSQITLEPIEDSRAA